MSKFAFYQVINNDGSRSNHGVFLKERSIQEFLDDILCISPIRDAMSVGFMGSVDCERFVPGVLRQTSNKATDSEEPEAAVNAIELQYPVNFSLKAKRALEEIEGANACYYYMEHFIITDESCDLTKDIRWEGNTLEEMEKWLEEQADLLEPEK